MHNLGKYARIEDVSCCILTGTFYVTYTPTIFLIFIHYFLPLGPIPFTNGALVARPQYGIGYVSPLSPLRFGDPETAGVI